MGNFLAFLIGASPFLFYSYKSGVFPSGKVWETPYFVLTSHYYENFTTFVWVFFGKFIPFYLLCIWFLTCRYWWYWAILAPIGMYLFQLVSLFNDEFKLKDEPIELFYIVPFVFAVAVGLYFIRKKILFYIEMFNLKEQIESEVRKAELELEK